MGPNLVRVWAVPLFFLTLTYSSLPVVASIFTAELCAIFLALSRNSFHNSDSFVIYSYSRTAPQALGRLYTRNPLVLKIQHFFCDLHGRRKFVAYWISSHVGLSGIEKGISYPQPIIMLYPFRTAFPLIAVPSVPPGSPVGTSVLWMAISWLS